MLSNINNWIEAMLKVSVLNAKYNVQKRCDKRRKKNTDSLRKDGQMRIC